MNGCSDCVRFDLDVCVDPGGLRIDDRHPGEHVRLVDSVSEASCGLRELSPRVHSNRLLRYWRLVDGYLAALGDEQRYGIGEVELSLRVARFEPVEHGPELRCAEDVDRRVDLPHRELFRARVTRFDDRLQAAVPVPQETTVVPRLVELEGENRRCRSALAMSLHELSEEICGDEWRVPRQDEDVVGLAVERRACTSHRIPRSERFLLDRDLHAVEGVAQRRATRRRPAARRRPLERSRAPSPPSCARAVGGGASARSSACAYRALRP